MKNKTTADKLDTLQPLGTLLAKLPKRLLPKVTPKELARFVSKVKAARMRETLA